MLPYSPTDRFAWAFVVGFSNTLFLSLLVIVCSTALGFLVALARRSSNPLATGLSTTFVEASRNTPLVVQLLFWYSAVTFGLPPLAQAIQPVTGVFLTDRGLYLPAARAEHWRHAPVAHRSERCCRDHRRQTWSVDANGSRRVTPIVTASSPRSPRLRSSPSPARSSCPA